MTMRRRILWLAILLVFTTACAIAFLPKIKTLETYQKRRDQLSQENTDKQARALEFRNMQEQFATNPAFVERTAREIGMIKPDETVIRFVSNPPPNTATPR
jgi:cell division protein FtsB